MNESLFWFLLSLAFFIFSLGMFCRSKEKISNDYNLYSEDYDYDYDYENEHYKDE